MPKELESEPVDLLNLLEFVTRYVLRLDFEEPHAICRRVEKRK
jgi:hypothetical protein